VNSKRNAASAV
jgi:hypothetical protein